ncbi:MAG: hypothetical protein ACI90V_011797 [Bacillariaceae sp.]|jgi:hypothetical protein
MIESLASRKTLSSNFAANENSAAAALALPCELFDYNECDGNDDTAATHAHHNHHNKNDTKKKKETASTKDKNAQTKPAIDTKKKKETRNDYEACPLNQEAIYRQSNFLQQQQHLVTQFQQEQQHQQFQLQQLQRHQFHHQQLQSSAAATTTTTTSGIRQVAKINQSISKINDLSTNIGVIEPRDADVLFGRGRGIHNHPGNGNYRLLIESCLKRYKKNISKNAKSQLIHEVANYIFIIRVVDSLNKVQTAVDGYQSLLKLHMLRLVIPSVIY